MSLNLREILILMFFSRFLIVPRIVVYWATALRHEFRQPLVLLEHGYVRLIQLTTII
jgi:hypothetical protein